MIIKNEKIIENSSEMEMFFQSYPIYSREIWLANEIPVAKESIRAVVKYREKIDFTVYKNESIKKQLKYYFGKNLNDSLYSVITVFESKAFYLKKMMKFLDLYYPDIESIIEVPLKELMEKYMLFLEEAGIKIYHIKKNGGKAVRPPVLLMNTFYKYMYNLLDKTPEREKDIWDGRRLPIEINYTNTSTKRINFTKVNVKYRPLAKRYIGTRIIDLKNITFSIGVRYLHELSIFLNFVDDNYPDLNIKNIEREHIKQYVAYVKNKNINDKHHGKQIKATDVYVSSNLTVVRKFLSDLKIFDWDDAPTKHIESLFLPNDNPHRNKKQFFENPRYIPDYIWDQVVENIHLMNPYYVPVILIMEGSGFRGSDVLGLKIDCLDKDNKGDYWLIGDQRKVNYKDHKVPISEELAKVILSQQTLTKKNSTKENNPDNYLFVSYRGPRKGKPKTTATLSRVLNDFAKIANITDVNGNIYRFKSHGFRHRYGVTLINNGMNIVHVQRLMAHASPEMTLAYAKIHDQKLKEGENS